MTTESDPSPGIRPGIVHRWVARLLGMDLERRHEIYLELAASEQRAEEVGELAAGEGRRAQT